jgi:signal transduction histidine kinase
MLTPEKRIILFRIFQELLNNALKYAEATIINISLTTFENSVTLKVQDNGIGLPPNYQKGIGHTSIENRVKILNGRINLEGNSGTGTCAVLKIPF